MKKDVTTPLVLEDIQGQVIRSYRWSHPQIYLVKSKITGRLEAFAETSHLDQKDFQLIKRVSLSRLERQSVPVEGIGRLRLLPDNEKIIYRSSEIFKDDEDEKFKKTLKWSAVAHLALFILGILSIATQNYLKEKEEPVVKIEIPKMKKIEPSRPRPIVKASQKKINRQKKVAKNIRKPKIPVVKKYSKNVNQMGALAALGGLSNGSKSGQGFKLNSVLKGVGSGSDSLGTKSLGNGNLAFAGKALSHTSGGGGTVDRGSVGYGTKGRSGGQSGYGKLNIGGAGGQYEHPMQESGAVDGGLEMSQIEAVIKQNIGQIFYCYEKALQAQPQLNGRVAVNFIINGSGRVSMAQVGRSSLNSAMVETCMLGKVKSWQFPQPHGHVDVSVSYPFTLKRARNG